MKVKLIKLIVQPFSLGIDVFINVTTKQDLDNIKLYIEKEYTPLDEIEFSEDALYVSGIYYYFNCKETLYRCILLHKFKQASISDLQNFIHELYHALVHIIKQVEVETSDKFDELMAYLLDSNLGQFLTAIKNKKYELLINNLKN